MTELALGRCSKNDQYIGHKSLEIHQLRFDKELTESVDTNRLIDHTTSYDSDGHPLEKSPPILEDRKKSNSK